MKQLLDFIPVLIFFLSYHLYGIFVATAVLIFATFVQTGILYTKHKKIEKTQTLTLLMVCLFGGFTLAMRNENILKWKAPILNWTFALIFFLSSYWSKKPFIQKLMEKNLQLPLEVWTRLNHLWIIFFLLCGTLNLWIAFTFHQFWVTFKVFGSMILMLCFIVIQAIYLSKHLQKAQG